MKFTEIVTAKIRPCIFTLIDSGRKRFEVRSDDFEDASVIDASVIHYVSSETGETLGYYEIARQSELHTTSIPLLALIAGVSEEEIEDLGLPNPLSNVYIAEIGDRIDDIGEWLEGAGK